MKNSELVQYLNGISNKLGSIGDNTSRSISTLDSTLANLGDTLQITNILLGLLVLVSIINLVINSKNSNKR